MSASVATVGIQDPAFIVDVADGQVSAVRSVVNPDKLTPVAVSTA